MRLSIISLVGDDSKQVASYLESLKNQENQNFEVVLCINKKTQAKAIYQVVQEYYHFFGSRLIVIYNTKENSYQFNLVSAFRVIKGDFVTIKNSEVVLKRTFVDDLLTQAVRFNVDVLEFKPRLVGSIRFKPKERMVLDKVVDINKNPQIYAYTFPFIFNKVFKKSLVKKMVKHHVVNTNDTKMCMEVNYILLLKAKTYKYLDYCLNREYIDESIWLIPSNVDKTFAYLENYAKINELKVSQELMYAYFYCLKILFSGFIHETYFFWRHFVSIKTIEELRIKRGKLAIDRHAKTIADLENSQKYQEFITTNVYASKDNIETKMLKTKYSQIIKDKILDNLE
ncbi:glycosyl transferase [Mycoplasma sp. Pen4]|uniref:glycosyltransferase n=1 Tax=Mycoplasma sp. Pen4 TaxID=640330 RepID=UPI0016540673|nr:glycosyltransferase [Mycoplasma sp. Pen4]QNM93748.1 glycosyl transferase [Mycoplasma sp. Pen4]